MPRNTAQSFQESILESSQGSSSQNTTSSSQKKTKVKKNQSEVQINIHSPDYKRKVSEMVRYIIFADRKKTGIKRADIVKNVLKDKPRWFNKVFQEASSTINQVFGFDVVAMETHDGKQRGYTLVNALDDDVIAKEQDFLEWGDESTHMGLLLIILSLIYMTDGPLTEPSLWYSLKKMGITKDKEHRVFGDVEKLINNEFTKNFYLTKHKEQNGEVPTFCYTFGPRSAKEISKRKILEFVTDIYGYDDISKWRVQHELMLEEEQNQQQQTQAMETQDFD